MNQKESKANEIKVNELKTNELKFGEELKRLLTDDEFRKDEPLCKHTTFRIGGPADYYIIPKSTISLKKIISFCITKNIPHYILGKGSNVLFGDKGFRGIVIEVGKEMSHTEMLDEHTIYAEAGISLSKLAVLIAGKELEGFEFASGIPGTLGGAIAMNAGAYGGEIKHCIIEAKVLDKSGNEIILSKDELELGYRYSIIQKKKYIVLSAILTFFKGNKEQILWKMKELNNQRKKKQPLEYPSAGSTFKRPPGHFAGALIEQAGLRGYRVGDAQVSEKHCGFVVNRNNATAKDILCLIKDVQTKVKQDFQVELETEVRLVGEF